MFASLSSVIHYARIYIAEATHSYIYMYAKFYCLNIESRTSCVFAGWTCCVL